MPRPLSRTMAALLCLACLAGTAGAATLHTRLERSGLLELGVANPDSLYPVQVLPGSPTLLAAEQVADPTLLREGVFTRLWVLRFDARCRLQDARSIPLAMPRPEQLSLAPGGEHLLAVARVGTSLWRVDLESGSLAEVVAPPQGRAGFVADPMVGWQHEGRLWLEGRLVDEKGFHGSTTLAWLDLAGQGLSALHPSEVDLDAVYRAEGPMVGSRWISPDLAYLVTGTEGDVKVKVWRPAGVAVLDEVKEVTAFWGEGGWLHYTAQTREGAYRSVLYDVASDRKHVYESAEEMTYPFVSSDGATAVLTRTLPGDRMEILYARAREGYRFQPLPGFTNVDEGLIRLSPDGRYLAMRNADGLYFVEIP